VSDSQPRPQRDLGSLSLPVGVVSLGWGVALLIPSLPALPAWPAASLGIIALALARVPGRALPRGLGAFTGVLGLLLGTLEILALWGIVELLGS